MRAFAIAVTAVLLTGCNLHPDWNDHEPFQAFQDPHGNTHFALFYKGKTSVHLPELAIRQLEQQLKRRKLCLGGYHISRLEHVSTGINLYGNCQFSIK